MAADLSTAVTALSYDDIRLLTQMQEGVRDAGFAGRMDNETVARDQIRMMP